MRGTIETPPRPTDEQTMGQKDEEACGGKLSTTAAAAMQSVEAVVEKMMMRRRFDRSFSLSPSLTRSSMAGKKSVMRNRNRD